MDITKATGKGKESLDSQFRKWERSVTDVVGNTPLVRLRHLARESRGKILAKLEFMNPTGSVKDRMAIYILDEAVRAGQLKPGGTIIEATSGNTGAAVAMYAAANGFKAIFTIPDKMSEEKINTLKAFGAEVFVCPTAVPPDSPESYYETARRIAAETENSYFIGQYHNLKNIEAHYRLTGPEIWEQTEGKITCLIGGIGTGGTISGAARYLKEQNGNIKVVAVDPLGSVYHDYFKTQNLIEPHTYLVEGIGEDMLCPTIDFTVIDEIIQVDDRQSFLAARDLARREGILAGGSSGAAVYAALKVAERFDENDLAVVILPDSGLKYLSKFYNDNWMKEKGFLS
ncbi:MAG: pyridoxal-phosphate dependent enzyme [bacterium]|jgi:cystathionine beta-synthase